jgi:hypothetical protein
VNTIKTHLFLQTKHRDAFPPICGHDFDDELNEDMTSQVTLRMYVRLKAAGSKMFSEKQDSGTAGCHPSDAPGRCDGM